MISITIEPSPEYLRGFRDAYILLMEGAGQSIDKAIFDLSDAGFFHTLKAYSEQMKIKREPRN